MAQPVLIDPALGGIEQGDPVVTRHPGAVGAGDLRGERAGDHHAEQLLGIEAVQPPFGAREDGPHVGLELPVIADALVDHLGDRPVLAMVGDGRSHPRLPVVVPEGSGPGHQQERGVLHVGEVEEAEGDGQHTLALEMVDLVEVHGGHRVVVERVHGPHPPLQ